MGLIRSVDGRPLPGVPEKRDDETALEYAHRLEDWKARLDPDLLNATIKGAVATEKGPIPWYEADTIGPTERVSEDGQLVESTNQRPRLRQQEVWLPLPPKAPKRNAEQRVEQLASLLISGLVESFKQTGKPMLPQSVVKKLVGVYAELGIKKTEQDVQYETLESLKGALVKYAQQLLNRATSRQVVVDPNRSGSPTDSVAV